MSRCPNLDYESRSFFGNSNDKYKCLLTGKEMHVNDDKVKNTCKADYGDKYKNCEVYKRFG